MLLIHLINKCAVGIKLSKWWVWRVLSSERVLPASCWALARCILQPWGWRRCISLKKSEDFQWNTQYYLYPRKENSSNNALLYHLFMNLSSTLNMSVRKSHCNVAVCNPEICHSSVSPCCRNKSLITNITDSSESL